MMKKVVQVSLPVNLASNDISLYEPFKSYELFPSKVSYLDSVFITSSGLVFCNKGLVKECCHYKWEGQLDVSLAEVYHFYQFSKEDPKRMTVLDNCETYLIVHHPWYENYFHWFTESIFRLWIVRTKTEQMILLLPQKDVLPAFAMDSLKIFKFKDVLHIQQGHSVLARKLCLPSQKPNMATFDSIALNGIRDIYIKYIESKLALSNSLGEKVYISRRRASRRKIVNEDEVIKTLIRYDFRVVYTEEYTFFEQVAIFSKVKFLISNHGAGLTNMLFMPQGSFILELQKRKTNPRRHHDLLFWYMSDALGHKYLSQICEPVNVDDLFHVADISVDINLLNTNLKRMLDL
jgi:capsular polysaccharide biosynthesis protein